MPVTVADLLADPRLGLRLHTGGAAVDRPLSWVHVSELADPTPFLEGGELLLTTGLPLLGGEPAADYVRRLVTADVVALGIGTGLGLDSLPRALLAAAEGGSLALLEVPRSTPFIAISRSVAAALAADEYTAVSRAATAQQELARAALAPGAPGSVVDRLARRLGGWALLLDAAGAPLHGAPPSAARRAAGLQAELDRLRGTRSPSSAAVSGPTETLLVQSLGSGDRIRGFLVAGRGGAFPAADRHVVNAAALLLTLRLEQSRARDGAMAALRAALLRLLLEGEEAAVATVVDALGEQLPDGPLRVVVVQGTGSERATAVDVAADAAVRAGAAMFAAEMEGLLVLLAADTGPLPDRLAELAERVPGSAVGFSRAIPWSRLGDGIRQAQQAAQGAAARGGGVLAYPELAAPGFMQLVDPAVARAHSEAVLEPLAAADRTAAGDLVSSLRVWLTHHGQWEAAAAQLGVHRHTLRKRLRRVADLLGRDLDDPGTRTELWLALHPPGESTGT